MPTKVTATTDVDAVIDEMTLPELRDVARRALLRQVRIAQKRVGKKHSAESRQKMSEGSKAHWAIPENRVKLGEAVRAGHARYKFKPTPEDAEASS